ncbi:MAG TPA: hypothetical protein VKM94_12395 [Blastocatellia bacterium]|nr:hypothetical protein [Blastocatellia bacterium]
MVEASYWLIAIGLVVLIIWVLTREQKRLRERTSEEYEADLANAKQSMMRAGLFELDKFLGPQREKRAAVEYLKDEEQGQTRSGGKSDDADRLEK